MTISTVELCALTTPRALVCVCVGNIFRHVDAILLMLLSLLLVRDKGKTAVYGQPHHAWFADRDSPCDPAFFYYKNIWKLYLRA